jgi:hypothetical protein
MIDLGMGIAGRACRVDSGAPKNHAIPLPSNEPPPNFFGAPLTQSNPLQGDVFIGDTQEASTPIKMIFVDDPIGNRRYLLNLQLRALHLNAAPYRPFVFALNPE